MNPAGSLGNVGEPKVLPSGVCQIRQLRNLTATKGYGTQAIKEAKKDLYRGPKLTVFDVTIQESDIDAGLEDYGDKP